MKDAVQAIHLALKNGEARGLYLIGSGRGRTVEEDVNDFAEVFGTPERPVKIVYRPEVQDNTRAYVFDISKARRELGWQPKYGFKDVLRDYDMEVQAGRFKF